MTTKQEVIDYYENLRENGCPQIVISVLNDLVEDETGICDIVSSFFDEPEYMSFDEIKNEVRIEIKKSIKDLIKISEL